MATNQATVQLEKAQIIELNALGNKTTNVIKCMFNPYEYTVSKSNSFSLKESANGEDKPRVEFSSGGAQELRLNLVFDTYEAKEDVSEQTRKLWDLMKVKPYRGETKKRPPEVAFHWATFHFRAFITSMTQKFTLFTHTGTPVRAHVDITFTQYIDYDDYIPAKPDIVTAAVSEVKTIVGGDRLDNIAAENFKDPSRWREIAERNNLPDPLTLIPGDKLAIPVL